MKTRALVVVATLLAGFVAVSLRDTALAGVTPICHNGLTTVERDPRGLLPLTPNAVSLAASAALTQESRSAKPLVVGSTLAVADRDRGVSARVDCGAKVWRRTVVVYITLRAFKNSASLSERVAFVGRFKDGYHVWQLVH